MNIQFDPVLKLFHLSNSEVSYILQVNEENFLEHLYWGRVLPHRHLEGIMHERRGGMLAFYTGHYEAYAAEYGGFGTGDQRSPAYHVAAGSGHRASELTYKSHEIIPGKISPAGLPATYVDSDAEATSLRITMEDTHHGIEVDLIYTVFDGIGAIARHNIIRNTASEPCLVERAMSASIHLMERNYQMVRLGGSWGRERGIESSPLAHGMQSIESRRGSSGHQLSPFFALSEHGQSETTGEVYALSLVYSGNFIGQAEVCANYTTRAMIGLGSFDFSWKLESGESFTTPEAVLVYSDQGLGKMSRTYHELYRTRLCRGPWRDATRPVLINNWEGTYFDFTPDKLVAIAKEAAAIGLDLFVLDDGWFGKRDSDNSGLGDWVVNEKKIPGGLESLARRINDEGLKFGLWFEPEMISPDSDLYRAHPDWCLHIPGRRRTEARNQLVLDFSRKEVRSNILGQITAILESAPIEYVKWDFNRNLTEVGSAGVRGQALRELPHRYLLGLYEVLEALVQRFPHILWESCSGGGGRFDPGMLHYMPQTWASDNSDAVSRLKIQYGTSLVYPASSVGSHVTVAPNHQVRRSTSLEMRALTACFGTFGYELDLTKESAEVKAQSKTHIKLFREIAPIIHHGDLYRLRSPFLSGQHPAEGSNEAAWIYVDRQQRRAVVYWARVLQTPNPGTILLPLQGLNPDADYEVREFAGESCTRTGAYLLQSGLKRNDIPDGDFHARLWVLEQKQDISEER